MTVDPPQKPGLSPSGRLERAGGRAAASTLGPVTGAMRVVVAAGVNAPRRVAERVLDSGEPERIVVAALNDARVQAIARRALRSDGARRLVDSLFESGLIDHFLDRLGKSDALTRLVEEIAQSPVVMAALSQQGLGFADQVGRAARDGSRTADARVARIAGRVHRPQNGDQTDSGVRER